MHLTYMCACVRCILEAVSTNKVPERAYCFRSCEKFDELDCCQITPKTHHPGELSRPPSSQIFTGLSVPERTERCFFCFCFVLLGIGEENVVNCEDHQKPPLSVGLSPCGSFCSPLRRAQLTTGSYKLLQLCTNC